MVAPFPPATRPWFAPPVPGAAAQGLRALPIAVNVAVVNAYKRDARLGLHVDRSSIRDAALEGARRPGFVIKF